MHCLNSNIHVAKFVAQINSVVVKAVQQKYENLLCSWGLCMQANVMLFCSACKQTTTITDRALCAKDHDDVNYSLLALKRTLSDRAPLVTLWAWVHASDTRANWKCIYKMFLHLFTDFIGCINVTMVNKRAFMKVFALRFFFWFTISLQLAILTSDYH